MVKKISSIYLSKFRGLSRTFFANIIIALGKWIILILIARILTTKEVGEYTLAFAITAPISLLINMKLRSLYVTEENEENFKDYLILRLILNIFTFTFVSIMTLIFLKDQFFLIIVIMFNKLLDLHSESIYSFYHKRKRFVKISNWMITKLILEVLIFGVALFITKNLNFSLLISLFFKLIYVFIFEINSIKNIFKNQKYSFDNIYQILKLGIPLGIVQMIVSLNTNIPRYYLEHFEDVKTLGIFSSIAYILIIFNLFASSISQFFLPRLHELNLRGETKELKRFLNKKMNFYVICIGIFITVFLVMFGKWILLIIYGEDYATMNNLLIIISISTLLNTLSWNYDTALMSIRYISIQPKITLVTLLINIIISFYLIKYLGVYGASYSLVITSLIQLLLRIFYFNKKIERGVINK